MKMQTGVLEFWSSVVLVLKVEDVPHFNGQGQKKL